MKANGQSSSSHLCCIVSVHVIAEMAREHRWRTNLNKIFLPWQGMNLSDLSTVQHTDQQAIVHQIVFRKLSTPQ